MTTTHPRIALTLGDVAGIGPEIVARACQSESVRALCRPVVIGHPQVLQRALRLIKSDAPVREIDGPHALSDHSDEVAIPCWNPAGDEALDVTAGTLDPRAGRAAYAYLVAATQSALAGEVDAIVTAPLNKAALHRAELFYPGHTEILAEQCGAQQFAMMLYMPSGPAVRAPFGLGVAHVTLHTSIRSVPDLLETEGICDKIELVHQFLMDIGCDAPRIAVCALNPHGGEQGLFGDEESRVIAPAIAASAAVGIDVTGPLPADTLFQRAARGEFDGAVAMYHDQGHIALKLLGFDRAVNITLGLPIVRTSPSHGTAFDIAGTGQADPAGMIEAIRIAAMLTGSGRGR